MYPLHPFLLAALVSSGALKLPTAPLLLVQPPWDAVQIAPPLDTVQAAPLDHTLRIEAPPP